jgi:hypothetical protein
MKQVLVIKQRLTQRQRRKQNGGGGNCLLRVAAAFLEDPRVVGQHHSVERRLL